jgi:hypothetical protein
MGYTDRLPRRTEPPKKAVRTPSLIFCYDVDRRWRMAVPHWCDQYNLPRPVGDHIPAETLIYLLVSATRGIRNLPALAWAYVLPARGRQIPEA